LRLREAQSPGVTHHFCCPGGQRGGLRLRL